MLRESRKEKTEYKVVALESTGTVLKEMKLDRFKAIYEIVGGYLPQSGINEEEETEKEEDDADDGERKLKLQHSGLVCVGLSWPENKDTVPCPPCWTSWRSSPPTPPGGWRSSSVWATSSRCGRGQSARSSTASWCSPSWPLPLLHQDHLPPPLWDHRELQHHAEDDGGPVRAPDHLPLPRADTQFHLCNCL